MKRRFKNKVEQYAFENACDCLYYGFGRKIWNNLGLDKETSDRIWQLAINVLVNDERY